MTGLPGYRKSDTNSTRPWLMLAIQQYEVRKMDSGQDKLQAEEESSYTKRRYQPTFHTYWGRRLQNATLSDDADIFTGRRRLTQGSTLYSRPGGGLWVWAREQLTHGALANPSRYRKSKALAPLPRFWRSLKWLRKWRKETQDHERASGGPSVERVQSEVLKRSSYLEAIILLPH
ncbi:hypothetical protein AB1N83_007236 [Pleurotus pulmonarius]